MDPAGPRPASAPEPSGRTGACSPRGVVPIPDRLAATEFYAGLLVPDFPADYRAAFDGMRAAALPLSELLPQAVTPGGVLVVISGLDYESLRLTPQSQIRKL